MWKKRGEVRAVDENRKAKYNKSVDFPGDLRIKHQEE